MSCNTPILGCVLRDLDLKLRCCCIYLSGQWVQQRQIHYLEAVTGPVGQSYGALIHGSGCQVITRIWE